jgi:K+-sensing histidine kinase KdpD
MVSFIKPEAYRTISDFKRTNVSALVNERIQIFKDMNGAVVTIDIPSDEFVNTDQKLLGVVIHNLADNAIKAKKGNKIEISAERRNHRLFLFFSDQGPGMPDELIDWFNTVSSEENAGLPATYEGLGLLMVKEITKILNISVHVANSPGACISLQFRPEMIR